MARNFITNNKEHKTLQRRLNTLIGISSELKFLVGFFYFSGWQSVYESLQENSEVKVKLLVGLQVDKILSSIVVEHGNQDSNLSGEEQFNQFIHSLSNGLNNEEMDTEEFYYQVEFFLRMIIEERLIIRKTFDPNHAKLYLFRLNESQAELQGMSGQFVTGSSNLTKAGLKNQNEFNVEIKDYGFEEAEAWFDELWQTAVPITEIEERRKMLVQFVQHKTHAATVTPFEAYALILKTFLDLQNQQLLEPHVEELLKNIGFKNYSYQSDAVNQALSIINEYNGVIIADVVGLGKSVIAAMIAKQIGKRGMVICPPGLIGDRMYNTGWWEYINNFRLSELGWQVVSRGKMLELSDYVLDQNFDVIIVDEAHYFRNQDTEDYEALLNICRGRKVILLTATPFNNSPADVFSLLKLFLIPGKSVITIEENLEAIFRGYNYRFSKLSFISKNHSSNDDSKRRKAERYYIEALGEQLPVEVKKVQGETKRLANDIKGKISPVLIRRNRLDLKQDFEYAEEVKDLSEVKDPVELFYGLDEEQDAFYTSVIKDYFSEDGRFHGAIYKPYSYEKIIDDEDRLDESGNRSFQQQRNLYDFMRRLLVKRFESSFGAFSNSINRFLGTHLRVQAFIKNSGGKYILDRKLIESIYTLDEEEIDSRLTEFEKQLEVKKAPKHDKVYNVNDFQRKQEFLEHIESDIELFKEIKNRIEELDLVNNDPKRAEVVSQVNEILSKEKGKRKVIIFTEYVDTVTHLEKEFRQVFKNDLFTCDGKLTKKMSKLLNENFNAQHKGTKTDNFKVLITSDKLSEGFNLNRAGVIINYDIPWNPTRVIQRVGRINRIGAKVFDELFIYNFFPSQKGAGYVKSREIAEQKMFLIHNALGEDAKIFDPEEEPSAAKLYNKINESPDEDGELSIATLIRNRFHEIVEKYPEVIEKISNLPNRVKTAKAFNESHVNVLRKKGLSLFAQQSNYKSETEKVTVDQLLIDDLIPLVECEFEEPRLVLSEKFWPCYQEVKHHVHAHQSGTTDLSLDRKAHEHLKVALKIAESAEMELVPFMHTLVKDIRKYQTLSKYSLGRLGRVRLNLNPSDKTRKAFFDEVRWLKKHLGSDYLDKAIEKTEKQALEVIIAVENQIGENG